MVGHLERQPFPSKPQHSVYPTSSFAFSADPLTTMQTHKACILYGQISHLIVKVSIEKESDTYFSSLRIGLSRKYQLFSVFAVSVLINRSLEPKMSDSFSNLQL